jgi:ubiquinone/menaquinone biosynthesis C-methylase UbiE
MVALLSDSVERLHVCPHQIGFILDNGIRRLIQNPKKILNGYIKRGDIAIDMGCGPGFFTIDMAQMVGEEGTVIAVDLQKHMLSKVRMKAEKHGLSDRVKLHQCERDRIGLRIKANFILTYYMIHETPDPENFLKEMRDMLFNDGKILVVEPKLHVSENTFNNLLTSVEEVGLIPVEFPKKKGGRSVLLKREI